MSSRFTFAPPRLRPALAALLALSALVPLTFAQDDFLPTGPNTDPGGIPEGQRIRAVPGAPGSYETAWWAVGGRTYIPQRSTDLLVWESFPVIETGQNAAVSYGFTSESPRVFVRLRYLEQTYADPYAADFDADGISNQAEIDAQTDVFSTDLDRDGMPDAWEIAHGFDHRNAADASTDANGNGVSNLDEYREGTDPNLNFYQGVAPVLTVIDGADQARRPGQFLLRPMRVRVTHADGTPWSGAPVRFTARADEGLLSVDNTGVRSLHPALTVNADADGHAQVWLKCP